MKHATTFVLMAAASALFAAQGASAGDMTGLFGNTIECTYPNGNVTKVWVKDGGQYTVLRDGNTVNGTWVDNGDQACYTETDPAPPAGTKPVCASSAPMKIGATWSITDPSGATSQCVLKQGAS